MKTPLLLSFCLILLGCGQGEKIEISPDQFSDKFPAMWFNPTTGEVAAVESLDSPPNPEFEILIEPRSAEIRMRPCSMQAPCGFTELGYGNQFFEQTEPVNLRPPEKSKLLWTASKTVFYIKGKAAQAEGLMMILNMNKRNQEIAFRWKPLNSIE